MIKVRPWRQLILSRRNFSHQGGNREEEISELEASLERLRSERMRRSAEKHEAGPSGVGFCGMIMMMMVVMIMLIMMLGQQAAL